MTKLKKNFGIIGGGIAGCAAAYELHKKGYQVEILEQAAQIGGRTISFNQDELFFNTGAAFITNFYDRTFQYISELGLKDQLIQGKNAEVYMVEKEKTVPFDVADISTFIKFPYITTSDKFSMVFKNLGLMLSRRKYDWVNPAHLSADDSESVAQFGRRVFNERIYQYLIRQSIEPYWYFSAEEVSSAMVIALQINAMNAKFFTFAQGMDTISRKISSIIPTQLNTKVESVSMNNEKVLVQTNNGAKKYDGIVIATPATIASKLVQDIPSVTDFQKDFLASQKYLKHIVIGYNISSKNIEALSGEFHPIGDWDYGAVAVLVKGYPSKHPHKEVVVVYLTKALSEAIIHKSDEEIAKIGWTEGLKLCSDLPAEFLAAQVTRRELGMPIPEVGRFKAAAKFIDQQSGSVSFAGDYLTIPCIEGCIYSAQEAAKAITESSSLV